MKLTWKRRAGAVMSQDERYLLFPTDDGTGSYLIGLTAPSLADAKKLTQKIEDDDVLSARQVLGLT